MRRLILPLLLVVLLPACQVLGPDLAPETPRERVAAAESAFQGAVESALELRAAGLVEPDSDLEMGITASIASINAALASANAAVQGGDTVGAIEWVDVALAATAALNRQLGEVGS